MKLLAAIGLAFIVMAFKADNLTQNISEVKIKLDLPNASWSLHEKKEMKTLTVYFFKREAILDNEVQVIPNISVIVEDVDKDVDAITYSIKKRTQTGFKVSEVFAKDSKKINFENAVCYKGNYTDAKDNEHTIYSLYGVNNQKGFQVICDITTNLFSKVDSEFLATLKSIRL